MLDVYLPYINYALIAGAFGITLFQAVRLNKLEDKVRRLDKILSDHLALDPRYTTLEKSGGTAVTTRPAETTACAGCGNAFSCTYPECQR